MDVLKQLHDFQSQELKAATDEREKLQAKFNKLKEKAQAINELLKETKQKLSHSDELARNLQASVQNKDLELSRVSNEIEATLQIVVDLEAKEANAKLLLDNLSQSSASQLESANAENNQLKQRVAQLECDQSVMKDTLTSTDAKLVSVNETNNSLTADLAILKKGSEETIQKLNVTIKALEQQLLTSGVELKQSIDDLALSQAKIADLKSQLDVLEQSNAELLRKHNALVLESEASQASISILEQSNSRQQAEIELLQKQQHQTDAEAKDQVRQLTQQNAIISDQIRLIETQLQDKTSQAREYQEQCSTLSFELDATTAKLNALQSSAAELGVTTKSYEDQIHDFQQKIDQISNHESELMASLEIRDAQIIQLGQQISSLAQQAENNAELDQMQGVCSSTKAQLQAKVAEALSLEEQIREIKAQQTHEKLLLEEKMGALQESKGSQMAALEEEMQGLRELNESLTSKLEEHIKQLSHLRDEHLQTIKMHEVSQAQQNSKSESLLINLEAKLADSESSSKSLNATLSQANMQLDSLRVENSSLKNEIATVADMRKAMAEQLEELGAAKKKATQLLQQVEIMRETISSLEQERMDVERRIKEQQETASSAAQELSLKMQLEEKFMYLRNVVFQYLIGVHESEALVRVMAAVLDFSPEQEQRVVEKEAQKHAVTSTTTEVDGDSLTPQTPSSTNSMNVVGIVAREVIVDNNRDLLDVNTTSEKVGCDQDSCVAIAEVCHHILSILLRHLSMNQGHREILLHHFLCQYFSRRTGITEDDGLGNRKNLKKIAENVELKVVALTVNMELFDAIQGDLLYRQQDLNS